MSMQSEIEGFPNIPAKNSAKAKLFERLYTTQEVYLYFIKKKKTPIKKKR